MILLRPLHVGATFNLGLGVQVGFEKCGAGADGGVRGFTLVRCVRGCWMLVNIGALRIRIGFWPHFTIDITRKPKII